MMFKYGNGSTDVSAGIVEFDCCIGGRRLELRLHVVPGLVPLLLSKATLKAMGARIDLGKDGIYLGKVGVTLPLHTGPSGHYQLDLIGTGPLTTSVVDFQHAEAEEFCVVEFEPFMNEGFA